MAENIRIIARNLFDEASLSATDSVTPVELMQQSRRTRWRSATNNTQVISGTLPGYGAVDGVSIAHHNLLAGAQWRLVLKDGFTEVYDSGWLETVLYIPAGLFRPGITPWMASYNEQLPVQMCVHWFEIKVCTAFEIHLKPAADTTYIEAGRVFLGQSLSPKLNMDWGCQLTYVEHGQHRRSDAEGLWTVGRGVSRKFNIDLNYLEALQRSEFALELVGRGIQQDLLISGYPERGDVLELEHTMICKRAESFSSPHTAYDQWATQLEFLET